MTQQEYEEAIKCVASIITKWNSDGTAANYLLDTDDSEIVVKALIDAGFLK